MSRCNYGRAREEAFNMLGLNSENSEQQKALAEIMQGEVFVILPAGFSKSVLSMLLYDKLFPTIVIVVTPLKARTTRRHTLLHSFGKILILLCSVNNYVMTQLTQWPALFSPSFFIKEVKGLHGPD